MVVSRQKFQATKVSGLRRQLNVSAEAAVTINLSSAYTTAVWSSMCNVPDILETMRKILFLSL